MQSISSLMFNYNNSSPSSCEHPIFHAVINVQLYYNNFCYHHANIRQSISSTMPNFTVIIFCYHHANIRQSASSTMFNYNNFLSRGHSTIFAWYFIINFTIIISRHHHANIWQSISSTVLNYNNSLTSSYKRPTISAWYFIVNFTIIILRHHHVDIPRYSHITTLLTLL